MSGGRFARFDRVQIIVNLGSGDAIAIEAELVVDYLGKQMDAYIFGDRAEWILEQFQSRYPDIVSVDFYPVELRRKFGQISARADGEGVRLTASC